MNNKHTDQKHVIINGISYDLTHLSDFIFPFETEKNIFKIFVYFSCHCFSDDNLKHNQHLQFSCCNSKNFSELRGFCINRYNNSLKLKEYIIKMIENGRVYFAGQQNFMVIPHTEYTIFFTLENKINKKNQINLFVQSAYLKKGVKKDKDNNIPFNILIQKIYNHEKIDFKSKKNR